MTTPPPNPYSGAPVPPNPYAGTQQPNPYGQQQQQQPVGYPTNPGPGYPPQPATGFPQQPGGMPQDPAYAVPYGHQPAPGCRQCGAPHTANFAVRAHVGVLILMRFHTLNGPFCRQCGRELVRIMTTKTMCQGWWSPFSLVIFSPFTLLWNLFAFLKYGKVPPSEPAPGRQALEQGPPVFKRPLAYVAIIPLLWACWVVTNIVLDVTGRR